MCVFRFLIRYKQTKMSRYTWNRTKKEVGIQSVILDQEEWN